MVYLQDVPVAPFPGGPGQRVTNAELLDWGLANHQAATQSNRDKAALRDWAAKLSPAAD